jgi:uncharacterized protein (AIM24 family)
VGGADGAEESNITATIVDQASTQVLRLTMPPGSSVVTDQNTMSFMTGHLTTKATMDGGGFFNAFKRSLTGESFLINRVTNPSQEVAEMTLAPTTPSAIAEITIAPGEEWKVYPGSMMAATANVKVTGSLNIFNNFLTSFVTDTAIYTTLSVPEGGAPGRAWISGFGGIERRDVVPSSTPFILNNGTFLAMPSRHWGTYVTVGTAGGILDSFVTDIGFVMKIRAPAGDTSPPTIPVYMQTLNVRNFQQMITTIAKAAVKNADSKPLFTFSSDIPTGTRMD